MRIIKHIKPIISFSLLFLIGCEDVFEPLVYDCSVFISPNESEYVLPFEGTSDEVSPHAARVEPSTQSEISKAQYYALDIGLEIGHPLVASRNGKVVRVIENFKDGDNEPGHENLIIIQHDDLTLSRYWHLQHKGSLVQVGDIVTQSQRIGYSGFTGNATGWHLHFDVVNSSCNPQSDILTDLRKCTTLPVTFKNAKNSECGLIYGKSYSAK